MPVKIYFKRFLIALLTVFVTACVTNSPSKNSMSDEKKAELNMQMGGRYLEMGMLKTAKEKLQIAEQLDSDNAEIHNLLGVLYERLKQLQQARAHYQIANQLDVDNASIKNNYGRFLCERGDSQQGMSFLLAAIEMPLNNRKWFAYTNAGRCELRKGKQTLAEQYFRQALQINKSYAPALAEMQKISYRSGKSMSARAFLERYLAVAQHNAQTLWYAVQTERILGNKNLVEQYRETLFKLFPLSNEAKQLKTAIK